MKKIDVTIIFLLFMNLHFMQAQFKMPKKETFKKANIGEQFDYVFRKSSNYQDYKVVKKIWLQRLKNHAIDSLKQLKIELGDADTQISKNQEKIKNLGDRLKSISLELEEVEKSRNRINFFGASIKKGFYKVIVWSIIILLLAALLYFVYSFKKSNEITQTTLLKYNELEDEYNLFRNKSLEREQALNRKLLDAINKQKT